MNILCHKNMREIRSLYNYLNMNKYRAIKCDDLISHCQSIKLPINKDLAKSIIDKYADDNTNMISFQNFIAFFGMKCCKSSVYDDLKRIFRLLDYSHTGRVRVSMLKRCLLHTSDISEDEVDVLIGECFVDKEPIQEFIQFGELSFSDFERFFSF